MRYAHRTGCLNVWVKTQLSESCSILVRLTPDYGHC